MTQILSIFSWFVTTPLNEFRKHSRCRNLKYKFYLTLTFCVWMLMTHTIIIWTWLTSVVNIGMSTEMTTLCVSTSGIFSFFAMAMSFPMYKLLTKKLKKSSGSPWVNISFGIWFAWKNWTYKMFWPQYSGLSGSTLKHKEEILVYTDNNCFRKTVKIKEKTR